MHIFLQVNEALYDKVICPCSAEGVANGKWSVLVLKGRVTNF